MKTNKIKLFNNKKEIFIFISILLIIFLVNITIQYNKFLKISSEELYETTGTIQNVYNKEDINILKIKTDNFSFFTSSKNIEFNKNDNIRVLIVTNNITFVDYLKGFYAPSLNITSLKNNINIKIDIQNFISSQHENIYSKEFYQALFLADNISPEIRSIFSNLGVSHLIAISGFHLGLLFLSIYFLLGVFYKPLHNRFFPYRNRKFDITIATFIILFGYLVLIDFVPSFLRSFLMAIILFFALRRGINIFSFNILFITVALIIAFFPKLIFSLSLWFSAFGVFYIYLYIKYFKNLNKVFSVVFFNFWIFFAMMPFIHYFFETTSFFQLLSPIITLLFSLFYPISLVAHFLGFGDIFDGILEYIFNLDITTWMIKTNFFVFIIYTVVSFCSIYWKYFFYLLNIFIVLYFGYSFFTKIFN